MGERRRRDLRDRAVTIGMAVAGQGKELDRALGSGDTERDEEDLYTAGEEDEWATEMRAATGLEPDDETL